MTYDHDSYKSTTKRTEFPSTQILKPNDVAWSATANDGQEERDVTNHTSGWTKWAHTHSSGKPLRLPH